MNHLQDVLDRLLHITRGCRYNMHEPDEQGIAGRVIGTGLDNAFGEHIEPELLIRGAHELLLIIEREDRNPHIEVFSLADIVALARQANLSDD